MGLNPNKTYVNRVITDSIPISKDLKRFLLGWYRRMVVSNGLKYAANNMAVVRETCLRYRADPSRKAHLSIYTKAIPIRRKGWVRKVLLYMDTQPMMMLNFLKLYVGLAEPSVTVSESAIAQSGYLDRVDKTVNSAVPSILRAWLNFVMSRLPTRETLILQMCLYPDKESIRFTQAFIRKAPSERADWYELMSQYHAKWHKILTGVQRVKDEEARNLISGGIPKSWSYKDYDSRELTSVNAARDYSSIMHLLEKRHEWNYREQLDDKSIAFVRSYLSHHPAAFRLWPDGAELWDHEIPGIATGTVGQVHHIPKKGTVKRRPIAVPNRFLQMGMLACQEQVYRILRRLPCDCTFDQHRFDRKILNRVSNSSLYVGSVDLSQATDNLPFQWGQEIWDAVLGDRCWPVVKSSYHLFLQVSRGAWDNDGYPLNWTVGQPLGAVPSFGFLALTHNILLEALSLSVGVTHSPYCILGDDLLVFNKKLRKTYITFMQSRGIPLSLQKSYEGNLVEFAGQFYIRRQVPRYNSDHAVITLNSLFDYQRVTSVEIKWEKLPRYLKKGIQVLTVDAGLTASDGKRVYEFIQRCWIRSILDPNILTKDIDRSVAFLLGTESEDLDTPADIPHSGLMMIDRHPVTFGDYGYAEKHGHVARYRKVKLPQWFSTKVRPCETQKLIRIAVRVLTDPNITNKQ